jgi:uncharacterized YccA/Bax inhibitor family protein
MSNPVFNQSPAFNGRAATLAPESTVTAEQLDAMYASPAAGPAQTGRLTYDDVIVKTAGLLAVVAGTGAASWSLTPQMPWLWIVGAVVGLVLGLVNAFKRQPSPALICVYAAFEGLFVGGISRFYEAWTSGVVIQALAATAAVFVAVLILFANGKVRASGKFTKIFMVAMFGYLLFALINFALVMTGVLPGFGMYQSNIAGIPIALGIGILVVIMAAYSFVLDFDAIKQGVQQGAPRAYAWTAAFGLLVTVVWLYLELLRLLSILRDN